MTVRLDSEALRARFPALAGDEVLMDNAGGAQVPHEVIDRIAAYLTHHNVQHGATYARSAAAGAVLADARAALATLLGAPDPECVVIGPSITDLLDRLARSLLSRLSAGDEVIVSEADHEANIGPWVRLERHGIIVKTWRVRRGPVRLEPADLERLLGPRTRLVAVTHGSNILGSVMDITAIAERVHAHDALLCVDGVGTAAHRRTDVAGLGADFYAVSLYKVFGPHLAVLWGKREALAPLANVNHFFIGDDAVPYKLQPGGVNYELAAGAAGLVEYLASLGDGGTTRERLASAFEAIAAHEHELTVRILDWLGARERVTVIGDPGCGPDRLPIVSFSVDGVKASRIPPHLDDRGIGIRWGDFYARRLMDALDLTAHDGIVRISLAHYNTHTEVDRLLDGLDAALAAEGA